VPVNCSAIPAELFESELFGYAPGAFTGAAAKGRAGLFETARDGVLFLDEIGDLPLPMQAKLLHVLSDNMLRRVGSARSKPVDVAVIAATCHDLPALVRERLFREDLFHRLNGATITLPPLRQRNDAASLAAGILAEEAARFHQPAPDLSAQAEALLRAYPWPGNLRELRHALRYALALADGVPIGPEHLPAALHASPAAVPLDAARIEDALARTEWNVSAAARLLGVSRATLHRRADTRRLRRGGVMSPN
ncbi:MAG: sigma 54-interacting transcriptional regulator, partial [Gluconacetobacter diazotrophicus]|nr:sigma 54-interacting transcriptional regulator [Gluconacetobacter diazotrophicus]